MVRPAGVEATEGVTLTEMIAPAFDDEPAGNNGLVAPVGSADKAVLVFASEPTPLPHPQPQKARAIRKMKKRKNGKLCG